MRCVPPVRRWCMENGIAFEEGGAKEAEGHNNKQFTKIPIRDDKVELLGYYYDNKLVKINLNNELNCKHHTTSWSLSKEAKIKIMSFLRGTLSHGKSR